MIKKNFLIRFIFVLAVMVASITGAGATSLSRPQDDPQIDQGLFNFSIAFELRRKCSTVKGRLLRAYFFYQRVYARARKLGFSKAEMDAYVDNKMNQARMQMRVDNYLKENGVDLTKEADYCAFASAQIEKRTEAGKLLRMR